MGQNLVQEKVIALGSQMAIVQMEMDPCLPHLVVTQLAVQLRSSLPLDPTLGAKMDISKKREGCLPLR